MFVLMEVFGINVTSINAYWRKNHFRIKEILNAINTRCQNYQRSYLSKAEKIPTKFKGALKYQSWPLLLSGVIQDVWKF